MCTQDAVYFYWSQSSPMSWALISNAFRKQIIHFAFSAHGVMSSAFRKHIKLSVDSNLAIREVGLGGDGCIFDSWLEKRAKKEKLLNRPSHWRRMRRPACRKASSSTSSMTTSTIVPEFTYLLITRQEALTWAATTAPTPPCPPFNSSRSHRLPPRSTRPFRTSPPPTPLWGRGTTTLQGPTNIRITATRPTHPNTAANR